MNYRRYLQSKASEVCLVCREFENAGVLDRGHPMLFHPVQDYRRSSVPLCQDLVQMIGSANEEMLHVSGWRC